MPKQKILIIDHDAQTLDQTRNALVSAGYAVEIARDGAAGLDAFRQGKPDLVVVDPLVPKKQGFEVCKEIKQSNGGRTPVLIATDSYRDSDNRESAIRFHGCDEFLERPLTSEQLVAMCRRFLIQPQEVPSAPSPAPRPAAKSAVGVALDDLDEDEIISRLDALIDDNFLTGDQPAPEIPAPAPVPVEAAAPAIPAPTPAEAAAPPVLTFEPVKPATVSPVAAAAAAPSPPEPSAVPVPVESIPLATPPAKEIPLPAATPPPAAPKPLPAAAPAARVGPLPAIRPVIPAVAAPRRTRRRPSAFLLVVAALAGLTVVAAIALVPRWLRSADPATANEPANRAVESRPTQPATALPPVDPPAAVTRLEGAETDTPPSVAGGEPAANPPAAVVVAERIPAPPANPVQARDTSAAARRTEVARANPPVAAPVATAPDPEVEARFLNPEPIAENAQIPDDSGPGELEQLMPLPEAPRVVPDTLFILAEVDVEPIPVRRPAPAYPPAARRMGLQGAVELEVMIDFEGRVVDVRVTRSEAGAVLDRAAIEGVKAWSYRPAVKNGVAVRVWKAVRVEFKY